MKLKSFNEKIGLVCPKIRVNKPDIYYSRLLLCSYAGKNSELSSISDYLSLSIECKSRRLSDLFEKLANAEIKHFKLLGELITALGGTPSINTSSDCNTESDGVCTDRFNENSILNTESALISCIRKEKNSIENYLELKSQTDDIFVQSVVDFIIEDERRHIDYLLDAI